MLVATYTGDMVLVYDANTLQPKGSFALSDPGNDDETLGMVVASGTIWIQRKHQILAYDPTTFLLRPGFPKELSDEDACTLAEGFLTSAGVFCPFVGGSTTADDSVRFFGAPDFAQVRMGNVPSIGSLFGDQGHVLVAQGKSLAILDALSLTVVPGSPVTGMDSEHNVSWAAASTSLNRFALAKSSDLELFALSTLNPIGSPLTYSLPGNGGSIETVQQFLFDEDRHQLVVGFSQGRVGAISTDTGVERVAPIKRGQQSIHGGVVDRDRGRIVFASGGDLVILDANTLEHVEGSPLALPNPARATAFY
jgi:hypothetical protein